jgi:SAM-dependent methyltransferase
VISRILKTVRRARSRLSGWSAGDDRAFHDELFLEGGHDPFSPAYPGYITIRRFADLASEHLSDAGRVLDLGCGPGEITCELARRFPGVQFHGVDHSRVAVERASSHAQRLSVTNATFECSSLETFTPAGRVDLILMFDAFHHLVAPAEFVARLGRLCDRFFLIEPAGDALGRWPRRIDFDWVPVELDKIRARTEHLLLEARGGGPRVSAGGASGVGRAVEHRYPLSDYESFFGGFHLSATGTVAGLDVYPSEPHYDSPWRRVAMDAAYTFLKRVDDRLVAQGLDLHAKHWAIAARRDGARAGRPVAAPARAPAGPWQGPAVKGPHDVRYEQPDVPGSMTAGGEVLAEITIRNGSWRALRSDLEERPIHVSYRWLDERRQVVVRDGLRSALPRPLEPGESCRVAVRLEAPARRGTWFLEIDLVEEGVCWFSEAGVPPLRLRIRVT